MVDMVGGMRAGACGGENTECGGDEQRRRDDDDDDDAPHRAGGRPAS